MTFSTRQLLFAVRPRLLGLLPAVLLGLLFLLLPPDGQERSPWLSFAGNFHILTVHFPIALLYLIPVLEIAGRHKRLPHLKASVEFVLVLAILGSLLAAALGWCLARNGAYSGRLVTQHMWGGIFVAVMCWVCWMLRAHLERSHGLLLYAAALTTAVGLVSWTGYRGGQLTQGENHLTEGMPSSLKTLLHVTPTHGTEDVPLPDRNTFYGGRVEPILSANCYSCHGTDKQKGQLRLNSFAAIMRGGKHGKILQPGNSKSSELIHRITLPKTDDNAMPPQGKRALTSAEIKTIEIWIDAGATEKMPLDSVKNAPVEAPPAAEITFQELNPIAIQQARASHASAVEELRKRYPNLLEYEARTSAGVSLNASMLGKAFGDSDVLALKPILDVTTTADFSGTSISDHSADLIASMGKLRTLQLAHTKITDATVERLNGLKELESLNLLDTQVTPSSLKTISDLPKLRHAYVAGTKITSSIALTAKSKNQLVF